ncbi:AMP-binding protein, partial [Glutamicibacter halophytocola]|uniref:AMP-binding protein n=1 Tax=Glutamicibacter halophytocola TaxID=1933880 RepID=UPI0015597361
MRTIGDWMRINYRRYSTREALVSYDQRLTYGELAERTWQLARGLQKIGITAGSNVGVLGTNTMFNAEMFFGVTTSGGCYVAYNWRWAAQELANGIKETGASVILVEAQFEQKALEALQILGRTEADLPVLLVEGHAVDSLRVGTGVFESPASLDSPLCIIYTGGSTGTPKG